MALMVSECPVCRREDRNGSGLRLATGVLQWLTPRSKTFPARGMLWMFRPRQSGCLSSWEESPTCATCTKFSMSSK